MFCDGLCEAISRGRCGQHSQYVVALPATGRLPADEVNLCWYHRQVVNGSGLRPSTTTYIKDRVIQGAAVTILPEALFF